MTCFECESEQGIKLSAWLALDWVSWSAHGKSNYWAGLTVHWLEKGTREGWWQPVVRESWIRNVEYAVGA